MNQNLLRQYVETRFQSNWTLTPIVFENDDYTPEINQSYIELEIEPEDTYQINNTDRQVFRNTGLIVFKIFAPANSGSYNTRHYIDEIAKLFAGKQFNNITTRSIQTEKIGKANEWYLTIAFVEYYYDSFIE
jgi:hypothetical protein